MCGIRRRGTRFISRDLRSSDGRLVRLSAIGWPGGGARLSTGKIWLYDRNHSRAYDRWVILYCKRAHELAAEQIRKEFHDLDGGLRLQLGAQVGALADDVWAGVLRYRNDRVFHRALRYRALWLGGISAQPGQSDLMIVSGTVTLKMAPVVKRIYDQMPEPKWVISMGACSSVGGPFNTYAVLQGVDRIVPVDVYVIGCPPRPENLFYALLKLQDKIDTMTLAKRPTEVRLEEHMMENFKRQVMVAQTMQPK